MKKHSLFLNYFLSCLPQAQGKECTLLNVEAAGFREHQGRSAVQVAAIEVQCAGEYRLAINGGSNVLGTRRLRGNDGAFIGYQLWQNSTATVEWGGEALAAPLIAKEKSKSSAVVVHPLYGTLTQKVTAASGRYIDLLQLTLSYPPYSPNDKQQAEFILELAVEENCSLDLSALGGFGTRLIGEEDIRGVALGHIRAFCPSGIHYGIGIDSGQHFQNSSRHLSNGTELLPYSLWSNSNRSQAWGDRGLAAIDAGYQETCPGIIVHETGTGTHQQFTVWGDLILKKHGSGLYRDTVNITLAW